MLHLNLHHPSMLSIYVSYIIIKLLISWGSFLITSSFTAELPVIFADKQEKAKLLLEGVENKLTPCLKIIVIMDSYSSDLVERGKKCGVEIISLKALEVSPSTWPTSPRVGCGTQCFSAMVKIKDKIPIFPLNKGLVCTPRVPCLFCLACFF